MTIQWGDTGRASIGSLKTLNITPYVNEQNITSTALPTGANASAVPASPIVTYTINVSTMAPTFSGINALSYKSVYGISVSGQNTNGSAQTLYYQINKNGTSYKTGNASITNNNYWTVTFCDGTLNGGDRIDIYVWTPATSGMNYFYKNIFCQPSRVDTGASNIINAIFTEVSFATNTYFPLTGKVGTKSQGNNFVYPATVSSNVGLTTGSPMVFGLLTVNPTYKLFATQSGDISGVYNDIGQSATNYPQIDCSNQVTSISYRDLFF